MKKSLRVFLTGSNGFIGKNILENLKGKYLFYHPSHQELDLTNAIYVEDFLKSNPVDIVVHAAKIGGTRRDSDSAEIAEANLRMFFNLARCEKYFKKMIFLGSGAEYDNSRSLSKVKEEDFDIIVPASPFFFYKYVCSKYIEKTDKIINLRLFGIYGKYEDYRLRFISNAIYKSILNLPITIKQNAYFDYLYINDFIKILDYFMQNNVHFKYYNLGTGKSISLLEIAKTINKISRKNLEIRVAKAGFKNEYTCNNSRLKKEIKNLNFVDFELSIKELYAWYGNLKLNLKKQDLFFDL